MSLRLIILLVCALSLLSPVALASPVSVENNKVPNNDQRHIKSQEILKYMNITVDPCEDFFSFACGNWKTHHPVNGTVRRTRHFVMANDEFDRQLSQMLNTTDSDNQSESDTRKIEHKVKNFYKSCLTTAFLQNEDIKEKLSNLIAEFGEMPILKGQNWLEKDFDWLKTVAEINNKYGLNIIIGSSVIPDWNDRSSNLLIINEPQFLVKILGLSRKAYQVKVKQLLVHYFSVHSPKNASRLARELVDFEFLLYKGKNPKDEALKKTTVEEMQNIYSPQLDVMKLVNISYGSIPSGIVAIVQPSYMLDVIDALQKTPKQVVANYIFFHLAMEFLRTLPADLANCVDIVEDLFPKIIVAMFYDASNLASSRQELEDMWQSVKYITANLLESEDFGDFDEVAREDALEKMHSMKMIMPLYEQQNFDVEYQDLNLGKLDYLENVKSLKTFSAQRQRESLEEEPNFVELGLKLYTPSYITKANTILFPPTALSTDFFWSHPLPKALNYARLGFLVSHEVMHGFSGHGRFYDKFGKLVDNIYEEVETDAGRRSCLSEQYHNISYGGKPLPQDILQTENVADNVGIRIALEAYRHWYHDTGRTQQELDSETLPSLNYTSEQLFFIHYSQMLCSQTLETDRATIGAADTHSPDEIRTYMPLRNLEAFSKEFNCPKGSPMNPASRCDQF